MLGILACIEDFYYSANITQMCQSNAKVTVFMTLLTEEAIKWATAVWNSGETF